VKWEIAEEEKKKKITPGQEKKKITPGQALCKTHILAESWRVPQHSIPTSPNI
jgi:hypothetical protein